MLLVRIIENNKIDAYFRADYLLIIYFRREDLMRNVDKIKSLIKNSSKFQRISEHEKGGHTLRKK